MSQLTTLHDRALESYVRDLLHEEGAAVAEIDQRRQELPYHPLLAEYQNGVEDVRDRLRRASLSLLVEAARTVWPLDSLGYLLTFLEEAAVTEAIEPLKAVVSSGAWLGQPDGQRRQMLALRTLLGLGWLGEPQFWLDQDERLDHRYPALTFRGLVQHGLEEAFGHLLKLVRTPDQTSQILRLFPSLIQEHSLGAVRKRTQRALSGSPPEVRRRFEEWFESRGYGLFLDEMVEGEVAQSADPVTRFAAELHALLDSVEPVRVDDAKTREVAEALNAQAQALVELVRTVEAARIAEAALAQLPPFSR